ncbi:MAG: hypothetical protein HUJ25_07710 [Crocinitomicaceae bacterium]|nr:hypothetical protein [Crocinitomicaceae bacterium]
MYKIIAKMRHTKYFSEIVRNQGVPNLSQGSFQTFMNIVHLEGQIEGLKKARKIEKESPGRFDLEIFKIQDSIAELTGGLEPKELMIRLVKSE